MKSHFFIALMLILALGSVDVASQNADDDTLLKCGEARLSVLFWDVYESALYTPTGRYTPGDRPLRLEIRYLRDIASADLIKQTRKEWLAQGLEHPNQNVWLAELESLWPDVTADDVLSLSIGSDNASRFTLNGQMLGQIGDPAFGEQFTAIWLSPDTTRPELRRQLIGGD